MEKGDIYNQQDIQPARGQWQDHDHHNPDKSRRRHQVHIAGEQLPPGLLRST